MAISTFVGRAARLGRRLPRGESGFTLVEALVASVIFVVISTALMGVLTSSVATHRLSRDRTTAQQAVQDQIEYVRRLPYDCVGLPNGNPPGCAAPQDLPGTKTINGPGFVGTLTTTVRYVNDPTPSSYVTEADYKKVSVTLTRNRDGKVLAQDVTYVAPTARDPYGGITKAILKVTVQDPISNTYLPNATVTVAGPDPTRSDLTDGAGLASFPNLSAPATSYYDITSSLTGYVTHPDDLAPTSGNTHVILNPGPQPLTLRMFQQPTINVTVMDAGTGLPYSGAVNLYVDSARAGAAQSGSTSSGTWSPTSMLAYPVSGTNFYTAPTSESLIPNLGYTIAAATASGNRFAPSVTQTVAAAGGYPGNLTSSYTLTLPTAAQAVWPLTVHAQTSGGTAVSNARVEISGGPLPTYLLGTTNGSGNATINVPAGSGYVINVTGPTGTTGRWPSSGTGTIINPYSATVLGTANLNDYYRFGESSGTTAADGKGSSPGTYTNGPTLGVTGALSGDPDTAATFDGVNDYVSMARNVGGNFSIEFWFKSTQGIGTGGQWYTHAGLVDSSVSGTTNNDFGVALGSDGKVYAGIGNPDTTIASGSGGYNNGAWHQVVFTRQQNTSNSTLTLYVDGSQVAATTGGNKNTLSAASTINVGRLLQGTNYFAGSIDELSFYGSALSSGTVTAHVPPAGSTTNVTVN